MNPEPDFHPNDIFPFPRRIIPSLIVAAGLFTLTTAAIVTGLAQKPAYVVLYADIPPTDAAAVTAKLDADHVPYELTTTDGRTTIRIPPDRLTAERMSLAGTTK
jgi:flagellar biosynthesis/type III secretory pathway M-ring protein FliF/YscJ